MSKPRFKVSLSDEEAIELLGKVNTSGVYRFNNKQDRDAIRVKRDMLRQEQGEASSVMSARFKDGSMMTIDEYCDYYGIDRASVKSFKLVTHTAVPYYNIQSTNIESAQGVDILAKVDELIKSYKPTTRIKSPKTGSNIITQLIFGDTHIGMDNSSGLYGGKWSKKSILKRAEIMANAFIVDTPDVVDCIQVLNLGDFADGLDGFTTSRQHKLPQNMTNEEVFDLGVEFLTTLLEYILQHKKANKIIFYNVCNSNHSSSFDYFIAQAFKARFLSHTNIEIINERDFIGHITYGGYNEIITHGKDSKDMKFGLKPQLDDRIKARVNEYIEFHELKGNNILHKGDSHVYSVDKCDTFDYNSYLALAPSSAWCQINFNKGRSGFAIIEKAVGDYSGITRKDYEFKWNSDELK